MTPRRTVASLRQVRAPPVEAVLDDALGLSEGAGVEAEDGAFDDVEVEV